MAPPRSADRRPRGRPQRLPRDDTAIADDAFDGNKRLAWLLATTRLLGPLTKDLPRADFVELVRAEGVNIDSSRISRWESGLEYLPPRLVRAYEVVAGMPPEQLGAVRRALARSGRLLTRSSERPGPPDDADRIHQLLDGLSAGQVRGDQWLWVADQLQRQRSVQLNRSTWEQLCDQLVAELARSSTMPYLARYEAAAVLLRTPHARAYLTRSIGRYVLDPDAGVIAPVLVVLAEVDDPAANDLVLRLLSAPSTGLRRSAAVVASSMLSRGRLEPAHQALETHVRQELAGSPDRLSVVTTELATRLTGEQFVRVLLRESDERVRAELSGARTSRELVEADQARTLSDHIALHAELLCAPEAHEPDVMLRRLVREALFHVHRDRRHLASALLLASPFAAAVGEVALRLTAHADERLAAQCWALVHRLAPEVSVPALVDRLEDEQRPLLRARAAAALMWARDELSGSAVKSLVVAADEDPTVTPELPAAAVLALGLAGRTDELARIARGAAPPVAALARWAAARGTQVRDG